MGSIPKIKGRGAQVNTNNKFLEHSIEYDDAFSYLEKDNFRDQKTKYLIEHPKKIVNEIKSPDLRMGKSANPYQGCEHGCIYCYARNTHEYFGFSAGLEFEQKIIVKKNAAELLEKELNKKSWIPKPIMFSGNTDCYQPAEKEFKLTRAMLEICLKYGNPVTIITKNSLIRRDIDILKKLSEERLISVIISLTTLNEELRRALEPRTVSGLKRLEIVKFLNENGIPTGVNTAPIIPGLNDHEIQELIKQAAANGACWAGYTTVRLNGSVGKIFEDWIYKTFPNKAEKVLKQIKEMHGGTLNDSTFGRRITGEGHYAEHIKQLHQLARKKYMPDRQFPELEISKFKRHGQINLF